MSRRSTIVVAVVITLVLAALSTVAIAALHDDRRLVSCGPKVTAANRIQVVLTNMGGPMTGGMMGRVRGGMMRVVSDRSSVPAGRVTFVATNAGSVSHELVVLPLRRGQIVGTRPPQSDGRIVERGSLGEASATCRGGSGDGIAPGATGWTTLGLAPGRYELVCNLPGHYAAGMYVQLTVT